MGDVPDNPFRHADRLLRERIAAEKAKPKIDPRQALLAKSADAAYLAAHGATTEEISIVLEESPARVRWLLMTRVATSLPTEQRVHLERLEDAIVELETRTTKSKPTSQILALMKREAALLGLDAPKRSEVQATVDVQRTEQLRPRTVGELEAMELALSAALGQASISLLPSGKGNGHAH